MTALKTGDKVLLPGFPDPKLVASVSPDDSWFCTFSGAPYFTEGAVVIPLPAPLKAA